MKRRLFNLVAMLSALLCIATVTLWARSGSHWDTFVNYRFAKGVGLRSAHGRVIINIRWTNLTHPGRQPTWSSPEPNVLSLAGVNGVFVNDDPLLISMSFVIVNPLGSKFRWESVISDPPDGVFARANIAGPRPTAGDRYSRIFFPHAVPAVALAVAPSLWGCARLSGWWRRRRRLGQRLCPICGYDLRASPDRCPECGTPALSLSK